MQRKIMKNELMYIERFSVLHQPTTGFMPLHFPIVITTRDVAHLILEMNNSVLYEWSTVGFTAIQAVAMTLCMGGLSNYPARISNVTINA